MKCAANTARWFLLSLVLLLAASPAAAASKENAEVVLQFWNSIIFEPPVSAIHDLVDAYNEKHPTVHVEILDVPQIEQKLLTAVAGRVPPSVSIFDRFRIAGYAERGAFMPIGEEAKSVGIKREDFFQAPWEESLYKGKLYGVPFNTDVRVLFYNKDLFEEAGLDPDDPPKTWKELREYSRILTKRNEQGQLTQVGFVPYINFGNTWLYLFGWQKGVKYLSDDGTTAYLDDPRLAEALEWVRDFTAFYGVEDLKAFQSGFGTKELDPFLRGQLAMMGEEVYLLSRIKRYAPDLDFATAPLPWPEDGVHATWSGAFAMVVPTGAENIPEIMDFIAYMTSKESQAHYGEVAGQLPANKRATETEFYQDPVWKIFTEEMEYSRHRPVSPVAALMWDELSRAWDYGGSGALEPKEALRRAQNTVQEELNRLHRKHENPEVNWTRVAVVSFLVCGALLFLRGWRSYRKIQQLTLHRKEAYAGYVFAAPVIFGLLIFWVGPIIVAAIYSFCHYDVLTTARWTGLANYKRLFAEDPLFWKSLWNTVFFVAFAVPTSLIGSLGLALLLNARIRGRSLWRTLFYLPSIVPLVAMSLLFLWLFNGKFGLFNMIIRTVTDAIGMAPVSIPWMTDADWTKPSLVLMNMWTVGAGMIIFLAGLQGVPRHLHESALIDGANVFQRFWNITIPMLSPTIFFMLVINTINAFQVFTQAYLMTNGLGWPEDSLLFYVFYLFRQGFEYFNMGYASAMAWLMFLLILVITIFQFIGAKRWVYTEGG